jgi:hypothetical protein
MSSLAVAAVAYDSTLQKSLGPAFAIRRWVKEDHYFDRLLDCARSHELILDVQGDLRTTIEASDIYIAIEEPWPLGMAGRGKFQSSALKQQAEISGAVMAGLIRYGFRNIYQIHNTWWRKLVAEGLGITIGHRQWNHDGRGKWRAKEWALLNPGYAFMHVFDREVPDFPDLILTSRGKIPRPDESHANPVQPDDRYDALAMAVWLKENYLQ